MATFLLNDTGLNAANKVYGSTLWTRKMRYRVELVEIVLHTSANAGNRNVDCIIRPAGATGGHGILLATTGVKNTISSTFFGVGGATAQVETGDNGTQWGKDVEMSCLMAMEFVAALQAGDTYDVWVTGTEYSEVRGRVRRGSR
jgi:hypothetical protein